MKEAPIPSPPVTTVQGIPQPLVTPPRPVLPSRPIEPKGIVYTKRWVVDLLLDLAGYQAEENLVDALAVEPAAGKGAFLKPMMALI